MTNNNLLKNGKKLECCLNTSFIFYFLKNKKIIVTFILNGGTFFVKIIVSKNN